MSDALFLVIFAFCVHCVFLCRSNIKVFSLISELKSMETQLMSVERLSSGVVKRCWIWQGKAAGEFCVIISVTIATEV